MKKQPFPPLEQLCPSTEDLRQVQDLLAEDAAMVNTMLRRHGQPPLPNDIAAPPQIDHHELARSLLLQLMDTVIAQDKRIRELEQQLS